MDFTNAFVLSRLLDRIATRATLAKKEVDKVRKLDNPDYYEVGLLDYHKEVAVSTIKKILENAETLKEILAECVESP